MLGSLNMTDISSLISIAEAVYSITQLNEVKEVLDLHAERSDKQMRVLIERELFRLVDEKEDEMDKHRQTRKIIP